jgi:hypothetical protein
MHNYNLLPKNITKTIRYIKQDASLEQLELIKQVLNASILRREKILKDNSDNRQ